QRQWRCGSYSGPVACAAACRLQPPVASRPLSDGRRSLPSSTRRWPRPGWGTARWWQWWARRGAGKRRSLARLVRRAQTQGWLVLDSAALAYGQATPYFPVLDLLRRYCHLEERDDARTMQAKVTEQVLRLDAALQDTVPALLALLDALPAESPFWQLD